MPHINKARSATQLPFLLYFENFYIGGFFIMIKSMTGFGRSEYALNGREYVVEIKTINHRYLEQNIRVPRQYSFFEKIIY